MEKIKRIAAIDPGTGISSPTGLVIFTADGAIDIVRQVRPPKDMADTNKRLRFITNKIIEETQDYDGVDLICIETFVMMGKGGQTLQRMIGAAIATSPEQVPMQEVFNTTVKKIVGGTGKADKKAVAFGVLDWFTMRSEASAKDILKLIAEERFDELDAFAIGIAGYQLYIGENY